MYSNNRIRRQYLKRTYGMYAILAVLILASGCTGKQTQVESKGSKKIGISKIVAHPALDQVEKGIQDELAALGITATFDVQSANGDPNTATQIASKFLSDKVDAVVAIATPTAVAAANTIKTIPVVFSVVTDPIAAGLVNSADKGLNNVTGLSDKTDIVAHLTLFRDVAKIKTLGYIYTSSEANSAASLLEIQAACKTLGLELVTQSITNSSEVKQATQAIVGRVDGVYLTTDNTVFSALPALIEIMRSAKKPIFSSDPTSAVDGGCLFASGFDYYKAGRATGTILAEVLGGKAPADIPVKYITDPTQTDLLIDLDNAALCGITVPEGVIAGANKIFKDGKLTAK
jgi:putative ABC transport system substrate-binding protein